jgi:hypothetical protein
MNLQSDKSSLDKKMVRCDSCQATIAVSLFRCPDCGQITTGNEGAVSEHFLGAQMRARAAERKSRTLQCKACGKKIMQGDRCSGCNFRHLRNTFILIVFCLAIVTMMLLYLFA